MAKIPQEGRFSVQSGSDKLGNIYYTKNVNFDEQGYIKLSHRMVAATSTLINSDFGLPIGIGRYSGGNFSMNTGREVFRATLFSAISSTMKGAHDNGDGSVYPAGNFSGAAKWFNSELHVSDSDSVYSRNASTSFWTQRITGLTSSTSNPPHALEVFKSRSTLCVGDLNQIKQYNTAYASGGNTLTLPVGMNVMAIAYNNNRLGIITVPASEVAGSNQGAIFFEWDGTSTSANRGVDISSDRCMAILAYKSTFVILTRDGQWLLYNGSGFEQLATMPHFYGADTTWGDSFNIKMLIDSCVAESDTFYANIPASLNTFGENDNRTLSNEPSGIYCYDQRVGFYQRYSPSVSIVYALVSSVAGTNATTNTFSTAGAGSELTIPDTGNPIKVAAAGGIPEIFTGREYYIIKVSSTEFALANTKADALAGTKVDISAPSADVRFLAMDMKDYGASHFDRAGSLCVAEQYTESLSHILSGSELYRPDSQATTNYLNFTTSGFRNIGYVVTPKISASAVTDAYDWVYARFKNFDVTDSLTVKMRTKDVVGLPISQDISWTSNTTFTTTAKSMYRAMAYTGELECEILAGAGAGQMRKISSITKSGATYTVTLVSSVDGVVNGNFGYAKIENWETLGTITGSEELGVKGFSIGRVTKWIQLKFILEGKPDIVIEEVGVTSTASRTK